MNTRHTAIFREALGRLRALGRWLVLVFPGLQSRADSMAATERLLGVRAVRVRRADDTFLT